MVRKPRLERRPFSCAPYTENSHWAAPSPDTTSSRFCLLLITVSSAQAAKSSMQSATSRPTSLVSSPMVNEMVLIMLWGLFGWNRLNSAMAEQDTGNSEIPTATRQVKIVPSRLDAGHRYGKSSGDDGESLTTGTNHDSFDKSRMNGAVARFLIALLSFRRNSATGTSALPEG